MSTFEPLAIGFVAFDQLDQMDLTGPYEILSKIPGADCRLYARTLEPVRDPSGLRLTPDAVLDDAPQLDVVVVPGGPGQEELGKNAAVRDWLVRQVGGAQLTLSVCTGALLLGAAGLLEGRRATTHWSAHHLLATFGAEPVDERVVDDGRIIFAAGVTSGIDAALMAVERLRGRELAEVIQLAVQYAPEPPFPSGTPKTAPAEVLDGARRMVGAA